MKQILTLLLFFVGLFQSINAQTARVQVIHNCADLAADTVDVWLNNTLLLNNFAFRTASPFINAPAGTTIDISIQPKTSTDTVGALARFTYTLMSGQTYVLVASGIVSPTGYTPSQPFDIKVYSGARENALLSSNTDILVMHGSTDAPVVDVEEATGGSTLVNDLAYGNFNGYLSLPASTDYTIDITDATGSTIVARYSVPLNTLSLDGEALTVLASGFLNPSANSGGPDFGLYVALAAGGNLIALPSVPTSLLDELFANGVTLYPNPAQDFLNIAGELTAAGVLEVQILDMTGRTLSAQTISSGSGAVRETLSLADYADGMYILSVNINGKASSSLFSITH